MMLQFLASNIMSGLTTMATLHLKQRLTVIVIYKILSKTHTNGSCRKFENSVHEMGFSEIVLSNFRK